MLQIFQIPLQTFNRLFFCLFFSETGTVVLFWVGMLENIKRQQKRNARACSDTLQPCGGAVLTGAVQEIKTHFNLKMKTQIIKSV